MCVNEFKKETAMNEEELVHLLEKEWADASAHTARRVTAKVLFPQRTLAGLFGLAITAPVVQGVVTALTLAQLQDVRSSFSELLRLLAS